MPVVVLTASDKFIDVVPKLIQAGELPPDTPPDFGAIVDRANSAAQNELVALVPGAVQTGKRAIWELGQVQVFDGGPDGVVSTAGNSLFETEGVFVP